jgi:hypothetical protein
MKIFMAELEDDESDDEEERVSKPSSKTPMKGAASGPTQFKNKVRGRAARLWIPQRNFKLVATPVRRALVWKL